MPTPTPPNSAHVQEIIEQRLRALTETDRTPETVTVEWRGKPLHTSVISMPVELLSYNPSTHRIRAQRSTDPVRDRLLDTDPFSKGAQDYLHELLRGDPADPTKPDPAFEALKEDLREHGQSDPGIITRTGILINGNTRQAALKDLSQTLIRVGVVPSDAGLDDIQSIELSLQLRKDHRRDYSFMNFLIAVEERAAAGRLPTDIQKDFRIKATTYERARWILTFVKDAILRSEVRLSSGQMATLRFVDFEAHQGKLEELYRSWSALKGKSPDEAEAIREQRLLALLFDKSKTDLRLIEPDFARRYMKNALPGAIPSDSQPLHIPGLPVTVSAPTAELQALKRLTTDVLKARAIAIAGATATPAEASTATTRLATLAEQLDTALDHAGKQARVIKKRFAPADRVVDACDDLELAVSAVAEARATEHFDVNDLDEALITLRDLLLRLAAFARRGGESDFEGVAWLRSLAEVAQSRS